MSPDLYDDEECPEVAHRVVMYVHYRSNPLPGLQAVMTAMREGAEQWKFVRNLRLNLHPATGPAKSCNCDDSVDEGAIDEVCNALAALMPEINELEFDCNGNNSLAGPFFGRLAALYAGQLQVLHSTHPVVAPSDCLFVQLKDVSISKNECQGYQLPRMNPATIETLELDGFSAEHTWSAFAESNEDRSVRFPKLLYLRVSYSPPLEGDVVGLQHKLQFPALEKLYVQCVDRTLPLLKLAAIPSRLKVLSIDTKAELYPTIVGAVLPDATHLVLRIQGTSGGNTEALACALSMMSKARASINTELLVDDDSIPVPAEQDPSANVTSLRVAAPMSVDQMLAIIQGWPWLTDLAVNSLTLDNIQADMWKHSGEGKNLPALSTQIEKLKIHASNAGEHREDYLSLIKYLLMSIRTLKSIAFSDLDIDEVQEFVRENAGEYEHLNNVALLPRTEA
ncbi:hypothetical protein H4R19_002898 [Coemansia spiralis]|nr:hypothetical protein H4R19_002898 [Coemansia spiralis]